MAEGIASSLLAELIQPRYDSFVPARERTPSGPEVVSERRETQADTVDRSPSPPQSQSIGALMVADIIQTAEALQGGADLDTLLSLLCDRGSQAQVPNPKGYAQTVLLAAKRANRHQNGNNHAATSSFNGKSSVEIESES